MQHYHPITNDVLLVRSNSPTHTQEEMITRGSEYWVKVTGVILDAVFYTYVPSSTLSSFLFFCKNHINPHLICICFHFASKLQYL